MNASPTSQNPMTPGLAEAGDELSTLLASAMEAHHGFRLEEARLGYEAVLARQPGHPEASHHLGVLLSIQLGQPEAALPWFETALAGAGDQAQYWLNYVDALIRAGRQAQAWAVLPQAQDHGVPVAQVNALKERLRAQPSPSGPEPVGGSVGEGDKKRLNQLFKAGELVQAEALARRMVRAHPGDGFAWKGLGVVLQAQGHAEEALQAKRRAAELSPWDAEAQGNLGRSLREAGHYEEALQAFERAVALNPRDASHHNSIGICYFEFNQREKAYAAFRKALEIDPRQPGLYSNLSGYYNERGDIAQALEMLRRALEIEPGSKVAIDNYLFNIDYHPALSAEQIYAVYEAYDAQYGQPLRSAWRRHDNPRRGDRRLKVGYVSPDFRNHACTNFLEPLLSHHDHEGFEVWAYADLALGEDPVTQRYKA
ncbi:MAG: tetratricopeptide repeat protein, partial [Curvibacter sp.]|nr:tetratricopeptide repeat protein [Curvibacter sp.]